MNAPPFFIDPLRGKTSLARVVWLYGVVGSLIYGAIELLLDPANAVSKAYHVDDMPSSVLIDRKGVIRYVHRGYKPGDENEYQDKIRQLLRE